MLLGRIEAVGAHLRTFIREHFQLKPGTLTSERPPRIEFGDLAFPFPFDLAKNLKRPPRDIAREVVERIEPPPEVDRFEAAGAGYVNVFFRRGTFLRDLAVWLSSTLPASSGPKVIVEHTNINPNKAAHIGHLRNAALGDTFVRLLRAEGHRVEVQNYIDNTGVQVADVVVGFEQLRQLSLDQVRQIEDPFDYFCWDLYAEVADWYQQDETRLEYRHRALQQIETAQGKTAELAEYIASRVVRAHLKTMARMGVEYDVLPRESEILQLKFWEQAFAQLKEAGAIRFVKQGPNRGCWVMQLPEDESGSEDEKIIVRSNGTVTYVGKDIAYQLWKFGLLSNNFHYQPFHEYPNGRVVWITSTRAVNGNPPDFGHGHQVYNVIDVRQAYLQRVVAQGLRSLNFTSQAERSIHFSYEMVALSPGCCQELGIELSDEDARRPYVEVSGRKGLGVKADELIDKLIVRCLEEVRARQKDLPDQKRLQIARKIAIGALRYFLLKYTRNAVIAFDFAEALSFEGETGPYLQYSVVRANNIFRKLKKSEPGWNVSGNEKSRRILWEDLDRTTDLLSDDALWSLLVRIARISEAIQQSLRTMEVSYLAKHAFLLAQQFNLFYHKYHILSEKDVFKRTLYLSIADAARRGLLKALDALGIQVPERM